MAAERIRASDVALITGLTVRAIQSLADRGIIPSAAKVGSRWTFNEMTIRRWLAQGGNKRCETKTQTITSTKLIGSITSKSRSEEKRYENLYEQRIGAKRGLVVTPA